MATEMAIGYLYCVVALSSLPHILLIINKAIVKLEIATHLRQIEIANSQVIMR